MDGVAVHALIARCAPLDTNSLYCNLLQCTHFAGTSVAAHVGGKLAGWVSGYILPDQPDKLFIWQVAVAPEARGRGLARAMIHEILSRPACEAITSLVTSITPDNVSSWRLFGAVSADLDTALEERRWFGSDTHFSGRHPTEHLVEIGPFGSSLIARSATSST
jgi:L-2,4-diaminobutyric acid acetyltransferase